MFDTIKSLPFYKLNYVLFNYVKLASGHIITQLTIFIFHKSLFQMYNDINKDTVLSGEDVL